MNNAIQFGVNRKWFPISVMGVTYALILVLLSAKSHVYSYRFNVYPVEECPMNETAFQKASERMNCSGTSRYLCVPDNTLSNLIEFCTDRPRKSLYGADNCVRLEGTGDLNHYRCSKTFLYGCPNMPYYDENIYTNPACLTINTAFHCFLAERDCPDGLPITTEYVTMKNVSGTTARKTIVEEDYGIVTIFIITMLLPPCIAIVGLILLLYVRRKKKKRSERNAMVNEDYLRQYQSKTYMEVHHARCIILGCGGAGKSTLLSRLQDKPYKEIKKIESTQGIDVHVNIFEVLEQTIQCVSYKKKETPGMPNIVFSVNDDRGNAEDKDNNYSHTENAPVNEIEDSEENAFLLTHFDNNRSKDKASFRIKEDDNLAQNVMYQDQENTIVHKHSSKEAVGEQVKKHENVDTKEDDKKYVMKEILDAVTQLVKEKPRKPRITFLDFAGQDDYYAFHQIYLSPKTFYILVVDMSKSFEEVNESDKGGNRFASWKYKDYYKFWLKSIDSFSDIHTPVIVVGTHAEGKSPKECNRFFKEFFKLFDGREDLQRHLHTDRRFSIKFPAKGSKLENLSEIKKCISSLVQGLPYWGESMRLSWTIFEQILEREKTLKRRKFITRVELQEYNQALEEGFRMEEEELTKMLLFLHRVGALLFIDEENLRNTIILDVQWFVEAFKCIITYSVSIEETTDKRNIRFHETGELQDKELDKIWKADLGHDFIDNKDKLITFMEQLGLLAVCSSKDSRTTKNGVWYYFPCLNRRKFDRKGIQKHKSSSILCFQFDEKGQLPIFLFYHLVLKCIKLPGWSILREGAGQRCIYDRVACFYFQKHIVVICICKFQIQTQVLVPDGFIHSTILDQVQMSLEDRIQEVFERRKEFTKHTYLVGYKCQNGVLNDEEDDSFIDQTSFPVDDYFLCEKCNVGEKHYVENKICWILTSEPKAEISDTPRPLVARKEVTDEGTTSLADILEACLDGNTKSFKFHLVDTFESRKRLLQKVDKDGWNALHYAAKGGNREIFETLLRKDLDIFQKTNVGMTLLHVAAQNARREICQCVLENSEFKPMFKETSSQGKNACHYAAEVGCIDVLKLLAANDIDVTATTNDGQNIFHIACIYGKLDMCKYIADNYDSLICRECNDKWDATLYAAKEGNNEILRFLNEKNFRFAHKSESGRNALHIACDNGHLSSCKFLIEVCPGLLNDVDHKGRHAGHFAARYGDVEIMKYLVSKNAKVTQNTASGMNILHMACLHENRDMCKYLLENFPDLNSKKTEKGWTTVHFLAAKGNNKGHEIELFHMITKDNVEISALTNKGNSVLTVAIMYNLYDFCDFLFRNHFYLLKVPSAIHPLEMDIKDAKMSSIVQKYIQGPTTMD